MDAHGYAIATPQAPDPSVPIEPFIDFNSGYVLRAIANLPKQGATPPWRLHQNWFRDIRLLRRGPVDDAMEFSPGPAASAVRSGRLAPGTWRSDGRSA